LWCKDLSPHPCSMVSVGFGRLTDRWRTPSTKSAVRPTRLDVQSPRSNAADNLTNSPSIGQGDAAARPRMTPTSDTSQSFAIGSPMTGARMADPPRRPRCPGVRPRGVKDGVGGPTHHAGADQMRTKHAENPHLGI
jgi:hypothetical protein